MAPTVLLDLPDDIFIKILKYVAEDSFYFLGGFLLAGKRGYSLVHEPSVLKSCYIIEMVSFVTSRISTGGQFHAFFRKCVDAGHREAICYAGLHAAIDVDLPESIRILEQNVPAHGLSTLAVAIFYVCLGKTKEASNAFQLFEAHHADLRSETVLDMGESIHYLLTTFNAPFLNKYMGSFQFPSDDVMMQPKCLHLDRCWIFYVGLEGSCENCKLYWICNTISQML